MIINNALTGFPSNVVESLNRSIGQYKRNYNHLKVGITGRPPEERLREHLRTNTWSRMIILYQTSSINFANTMEQWLVDNHWDDLVNQRRGGGSELSPNGNNYVYLLLK